MASIIRSNGNLVFQTLDKNASIQFVRGNLDSAENSSINDWATSGKSAKLDFTNLIEKASTAAEIDKKYLTPMPSISLPTDILNMGTGFNVNIQYPKGFDKKNGFVKIWSDLGEIQNLDKLKGSFTYISPIVTQDTTDHIYVQLINPGQLASKVISLPINIKFVDIQPDDALVDNDFKTNSYYKYVTGLSF